MRSRSSLSLFGLLIANYNLNQVDNKLKSDREFHFKNTVEKSRSGQQEIESHVQLLIRDQRSRLATISQSRLDC